MFATGVFKLELSSTRGPSSQYYATIKVTPDEHSSYGAEIYQTLTEKSKVNDTLLKLAREHINEKLAPVQLEFFMVDITSDLLHGLLESVICLESRTIRVLTIYEGSSISLKQAEFENIFEFIELDDFHCAAELGKGVQYTDKILQNAKRFVNIINVNKPLSNLKVTDDLLEQWHKSLPVVFNLQNFTTSMSLRKITEFIQMSMKYCLDLSHFYGKVQWRNGNEVYLKQLNEMPNIFINERDNLYKIYRVDKLATMYFSFEIINKL